MRNHRRARWLFYPVFLLALTLGCQALHVYRPVAVLVRDAETKKPIPAGEVHISYPLARDSLAPYLSSGVSGEDGIARLRAAPYGEYGIRVAVSARGYLSEDLDVGVAAIENIKPALPFEATERRPADFIAEMYSEPGFTVELVVPAGYRGLIKAEVQVQEDAPRTPGQRCFRYEVSPAGIVQVRGPSSLRRVSPPDYRARYADGTLLGEETDAWKVGFRWLKREDNDLYFVVGTRYEYDQFRRHFLPQRAGARLRPPEDEERGGRGGRHR